jgi:hypothetical protein
VLESGIIIGFGLDQTDADPVPITTSVLEAIIAQPGR